MGSTAPPGLTWLTIMLQQAIASIGVPIGVDTLCALLPTMASMVSLYIVANIAKQLAGCADQGGSTASAAAPPAAVGVTAAGLLALTPVWLARHMSGQYTQETVGMALLLLLLLQMMRFDRPNGSNVFTIGGCASLPITSAALACTWGEGYLFFANVAALHFLLQFVRGQSHITSSLAISLASALLSCALVGIWLPSSPHKLFSWDMALPLATVLAVASWASLTRRWTGVRGGWSGLLLRVLFTVCTAAMPLAILHSLRGIAPLSDAAAALLFPAFSRAHLPLLLASMTRPSTMVSWWWDLHATLPFAVAGLFYTVRRGVVGSSVQLLFLWIAVAAYCSWVSSQYMVVLAPAIAVMAGVGVSQLAASHANAAASHIDTSVRCFLSWVPGCARTAAQTAPAPPAAPRKDKGGKGTHGGLASGSIWSTLGMTTGAALDGPAASRTSNEFSVFVSAISVLLLAQFTRHSYHLSSDAYSRPAHILTHGGGRFLMDDYREAYAWLRTNTEPSARILAWHDHGHHIAALANRKTIVDSSMGLGRSVNASQVAAVALAFVSSEAKAHALITAPASSIAADYVMVSFGGYVGYQADDIAKVPWMVRIARQWYGGNASHTDSGSDNTAGASAAASMAVVQAESRYFAADGDARIDVLAGPALADSLLYRLGYYRYGSVTTDRARPTGWDKARAQEVGVKEIRLRHFQEAFTSNAWLVRIFRVLHEDPL